MCSLKNITQEKIINILHQTIKSSEQLTFDFILPEFPYYYPIKNFLFFKIDSRVNLDYQTEGEIFLELIYRTNGWEKTLARAINTRHRKGIAGRIRKKLKLLEKLVPGYENIHIHGNQKFAPKIVQ